MAGVLHLPDRGRLLVATDLQGNLRDFERMADLFGAALVENEGDAHLLFTGDLIHGPHLEEDEWPDFLGEYYRDESGRVIERFVELRERYPGHVHALLGNHEHAHVGGPHTAKFAPDEVVLLEQILGPERSAWLQAVLYDLPLCAVAPCGIVFTHGAPAANIESIADVEAAPIHDLPLHSLTDVFAVPVTGALLWARSASVPAARKFLAALGGRISVFGHDVVPEGYERIGAEQLIVSTSFGVADANKFYLDLDLAAHYESAADLIEGRHLLPLYPDERSEALPPQETPAIQRTFST
jgi:Calcineurin-like phosphoesterase